LCPKKRNPPPKKPNPPPLHKRGNGQDPLEPTPAFQEKSRIVKNTDRGVGSGFTKLRKAPQKTELGRVEKRKKNFARPGGGGGREAPHEPAQGGHGGGMEEKRAFATTPRGKGGPARNL